MADHQTLSSGEPLALRGAPAYQLFMLTLCVLALVAIVVQNAFRLDPEVEVLLEYADTAICAAFLVDFVLTLWRTPNRLRYMATWGWLDLISSIPTLDLARWGRVARIARIARLLRGLRAARLLTKVVLRRRAQSTSLMAAMLAFLLIIGCSTAILQVETLPESNIRTAEDALWWAVTTITTVGYGDRYPLSPAGRFIAVLLMTAGVGLFGAISAALAAWFLSPEDQETDQEIAGLRREMALLREAIERLSKQGAADVATGPLAE
jgi:voltage-gated potassium channel